MEIESNVSNSTVTARTVNAALAFILLFLRPHVLQSNRSITPERDHQFKSRPLDATSEQAAMAAGLFKGFTLPNHSSPVKPRILSNNVFLPLMLSKKETRSVF